MTDQHLPQVILSPEPFTPQAEVLEVPALGQKVSDLVAAAIRQGKLADDADTIRRLRVHVDGVPLPADTREERLAAMRYVPKPGEIVNLVVVVQNGGGGGGDKVLQTVLTLAVVALSIWTGGAGGPLAAAAPWVRAAASAAVAVGGQMAVSAIFAPDNDKLAEANSSGALQDGSNSYRPRAPMPLCLGFRRWAFDLAAPPYTQLIGDDVYLNIALAPHYGRCWVGNLKIGETSLEDYPAGEIAVETFLEPGVPRQSSLYPNRVVQENFQDKLDKGGDWEVHTTAIEADRGEVDIGLPNGLRWAKSSGKIVPQEVQGRIEVQLVGGGGWVAAQIGQFYNKNGVALPAGEFYISGKTKDPIRRTFGFDFAQKGQYNVRVRVWNPDSGEPEDELTDTSYWTALRTIENQLPVVDQTLSVIFLRIKSSDDLNGNLPLITGECEPIVPIYSGGNWDTEARTSNAAALLRWVLMGEPAARPLVGLDFHSSCEATYQLIEANPTWKGSLLVTDDKSQQDVMVGLGKMGRFSTFWNGSRLCFVPDWVREAPRQVFSGRNASGYRYRRTFPEPIHAVFVQFLNIDGGSVDDELYVYADGYNADNATLIETLDLDFGCSAERAFQEGRVYMAKRLLQVEMHEWTAGAEAIATTYGDRVLVRHPATLYGLADGRVVNRTFAGALVSGFRLDEDVEMEAGKTYGVDVRLADGVIRSIPILNVPGRTNVLKFAAPRAVEVSPSRGDLVVFGETGVISEDLEIVDVDPQDYMTVTFRGIPYIADAIAGAINNPIPPLPSVITEREAAPRPIVTRPDFAEPSGLNAQVSVGPWTGVPISGFVARFRVTTVDLEEGVSTTPWQNLDPVPVGGGIIRTPAISGASHPPADGQQVTIDLEVRTLLRNGDSSLPTLVGAIPVLADISTPASFIALGVTRTSATDGSSFGAIEVSAAPISTGDIQTLEVEVQPAGGGEWVTPTGGLISARRAQGDVTGLTSGAPGHNVRARWIRSDNWPGPWATTADAVVIPGGSNVSSDTAFVSGVPASTLTTRLVTVEALAALNASAVADLEEIYGDTASAAASAAAAAQAKADAIQAKADAIIAQGQAQSASAEAILARADTLSAKNEAVSAAGASASAAAQAGGFKTDAETAAAAALQQKVEATAAREGAQAAANSPLATSPALSPDAFNVNNWTTLNAPANLRQFIADNPGKVYFASGGTTVEVNNFASAVHFSTSKGVTRPAGHRFRFTARVQRNVDGGGASDNHVTLFMWAWDESGAEIDAVTLVDQVSLTTGQGLRTLTADYLPSANVAWVKAMVRVHSGAGITSVHSIEVSDIESEKASAAAATAAATSAASAAASESAAGQSAFASQQDRVAAQTARGQAEGFRDQSSASATTAAGAAATATEQAGLSAAARDAAQGHASSALTSRNQASGFATDAETAAAVSTTQKLEAIAAKDAAVAKAAASATSAANAAASETAAGLSATASQTARTGAETARGQAETYRNETASARDTAVGSAATATTQAGISASSAATSQAAANTPLATSPALSPDAFSINDWLTLNAPQNLRQVFADNPGKIYPINSTVEVNNFGSAVHINTAKAMARPEGHRFRYSARIRRMVDAGTAEQNMVTFFAWFWDANGNDIGGQEFQTVNPGTAQGVYTFTVDHLPPAGTAWTRTMVRVVSYVGVTAVLSLETLDIESEKTATAAATASVASASTASTKADEAGVSASAASAAKIASELARDNASGSASASATSAGQSLTYRNQAGEFAIASGGSATAANTAAGNAQTFASQASTSAGNANTAAINAGVSAQSAADSATGAAGSAASALQQAANASSSAAAASISANLATQVGQRPNRLPNSDFSNGFARWRGADGWASYVHGSFGPLAYSNASGHRYLISEALALGPNSTFTLSIVGDPGGNPGGGGFYLQYLRSDMSLISDGNAFRNYGGMTWSNRISTTFTTTSDTAFVIAVFRKGETQDIVHLSRVMIAFGTDMVPWNDSATTLTLSASLSVTASTTADLATRMATAKFEVIAAAGSDPAQLLIRADSTGSLAALVAGSIRMSNVVGGVVTEVMRLEGGRPLFAAPISVIQGGRRTTLGPGFGVGSNLHLWSGPSSVAFGSETLDNGILGISATDGFFGGRNPSGPFDSLVQAGEIDLPKNAWTTVAQVSDKYMYDQAYIVAALSHEIYVSGAAGGDDDYSYVMRLLMTNLDGSNPQEVPLSGLFGFGANNTWIDLRALNFREATVSTPRGRKNLYFQINPTGANITVAKARNRRLKGAWTQPIT